MNNKETEYLKTDGKDEKLMRIELWLSPLLVFLPIIASILFIWNWFYHGYLDGSSAYDGELILGVIILVGNIIFDIPFIRSLILLSRK